MKFTKETIQRLDDLEDALYYIPSHSYISSKSIDVSLLEEDITINSNINELTNDNNKYLVEMLEKTLDFMVLNSYCKYAISDSLAEEEFNKIKSESTIYFDEIILTFYISKYNNNEDIFVATYDDYIMYTDAVKKGLEEITSKSKENKENKNNEEKIFSTDKISTWTSTNTMNINIKYKYNER